MVVPLAFRSLGETDAVIPHKQYVKCSGDPRDGRGGSGAGRYYHPLRNWRVRREGEGEEKGEAGGKG
jgi:hypothetical protein